MPNIQKRASILFLLALLIAEVSAEPTAMIPETSKPHINDGNPEVARDDKIFVIDTLSDLVSLFNRANQTFSYQSLFTYEANGYITTYRLYHRFKGGQIHQKLLFLDGPPREVVRQQSLFNCELGDTAIGVWSIPQPESSLSSYDFKVRGVERVADRNAVIFDIYPKDTYRYGYRYSVDKSTGLILKVITYEKEKIIERLQTVSLQLADESGWPEEKTTANYIWRVPEIEPCQTEQYQTSWQVTWLPDGFESVGTRLTAQGEQVLMYADGLVSLSVFITNHAFLPLKKATARHGATVMVVTPVDFEPDRSIAVVGEIPVLTARRIARSVEAVK
ncbi:MAG: sigma-E factor negative regulatory protein RseB [Cellvibrionaceae bacterium]|jgi:sigma-E factor negative regulatory protein RseB